MEDRVQTTSRKKRFKTASAIIIFLLITVPSGIIYWNDVKKIFTSSSTESIKIKGNVYKNAKNVPFKGALVIIKELQTIIQPKFVDDAGYYISSPIKRNLIPFKDKKIDLIIQIKYNGVIVSEETKTINFESDEEEASFGDLIVMYEDKPAANKNKKPEPTHPNVSIKNVKAKNVKGDINLIN